MNERDKAKQWIITNWNILTKEKRTEALERFFKKFLIEKTIIDDAKKIFGVD